LNVSVDAPLVVAAFERTTLVYSPRVNTSPLVDVTIVVTGEPPEVADNVKVVE
jgi:hypothetical protein